MWPSIPAYRSFANVACPSGANCELPHCIFEHNVAKSPTTRHSPALEVEGLGLEPHAKRLKLNDGTEEPIAQVTPPRTQANPNVFVGSIIPRDNAQTSKATRDTQITPSKTVVQPGPPATLPRSATRPVSPPPTIAATKPTTKPDVPIPLMPRKLSKEPATFTKRITLLKALHAYLKPQNDKIAKAVKPEIKALHLTPNQLIRQAVDEEEKIAKESGSVYENILKQRLVKLKAMTPELWVKERRAALVKEKGDPPKKAPPSKVDTGLSPKEEIIFLSALKCPQTGLDAHGYVTKLPTEEELTEARKVHEMAGFWEECDRCNTRFQVFPERREEDGALTTGGQCKHHWGRRNFPKRVKNAVPEPTRLTCCNEPVGSPGCVTHDTHVYNVKDSKRLSLIMPFMETPENDQAPPHTAVCFDCEMGYTTNGLEMLRLTVISWPTHKPLIDVLVRPLGHLLDLNTRFSGITAEQFLNAKPYDPEDPKPVRKDLRIVDSPYRARELFFAHVSPTTPVLGHALENDLNTIRIIHPTIIDTVLLYPTRQGLPYRHGLRNLAKMHLGEDIQQGGAAGHDSFEDARTTGELVRFKVKEKWKVMKHDGWQVTSDGVLPPMPKGTPPPQAPAVPSMVPVASVAVLEGKPAEKRKFEGEYEEDEHGDELSATKQG
ncbi:RNA exonuclease 3 [Cucurbitaria berberidis CBS 394.84]|uniref:RNA exonuclease 3 n=1 Tax=Cucurbitaria berberidis CBS 394.84 TaxID=1168544 RepID=A0A9P4LCQ8_9PLEO|nr:RNA exonuclease 3 [Cucurbitaria berberidis CBS 394.84]KAF1849409.1 RNA exonuclease 3 [Cucurbitaria berberidis CBS 394.84]